MAGGAVEVVELVKRFSELTAVDGINLQMPAGEFFSMLGPSGCGKTTTLRMIAGFERPDRADEILLDGDDMAHDAAAQAQRQHGVPELRAVPAPQRVDNVAFGLRRAKRVARRRSAGGSPRRWSWCS